MAETREEKRSMIEALKHEIASGRSALVSLKEQLRDWDGVPGAEVRLVKLNIAIKQQEKAVKAAGEQLAARVGDSVKRGRPPKSENVDVSAKPADPLADPSSK